MGDHSFHFSGQCILGYEDCEDLGYALLTLVTCEGGRGSLLYFPQVYFRASWVMIVVLFYYSIPLSVCPPKGPP